MMKVPRLVAWLGCAAALLPALAAAQGLDFKVEMKTNPGPNGPIFCNVKFFNRTPSKGEAERFAQVGIQLCMRSEPSRDIVARLLQNGQPIAPTIFAGALFYDHKTGKVRREVSAQSNHGAKPAR